MVSCLLCGQSIVYHNSVSEILFARKLYFDQLCRRCTGQFDRIHQQESCQQCGRQLSFWGICSDCQCWQDQVIQPPQNQAIFCYNSAMKEYFKQYKRAGDYRLRNVFAGSLRAALDQESQQVIVVPVPTSLVHFEMRQFDPVQGLFTDLVPLVPLLVCSDLDWQQSQLTRRQRLNAPQRFSCKIPASLAQQRVSIVLVDDIYTTGTTLLHGANALRKGGYLGNITSLTLAR